MARRGKTSPADDIMDLVAMLPWWGGIMLALVNYQKNAYVTAFRCTELALIYPRQHGITAAVNTEFRLPPVNGTSATVRVLGVDVDDDRLPLRMGSPSGYIGRLLSHAGAQRD